MSKVSFIGAGFVGSTAAQYLALKNICDEIVLIDLNEGPTKGKALDLNQAGATLGYDTQIKGSSDFEDLKDSQIVVISAGKPRDPGMDRMDLIRINREIVTSCIKQVRKFCLDAIVILVTNPLDVMCYVAYQEAGMPREKIFGMAGVLDTSRFRTFLAWETGVSKGKIEAWVLGGHGNQMVPVLEHTKIDGKPVGELVEKDKLQEIVERTRNGGGEIVELLGKGSAYYAPGASIVEMVEAILTDSKKTLPVSVYLQGEYGYSDLFLGVPAKLGKHGIEEIVELELAADTKKLLDDSVEEVKKGIESLD
ncbi:MAG: malate dehydrogenase [Candidatus Gracilibacteria bacterium]|nr:malate dehydrogenase [Candidatus Gracilibacteria bacterium]